MTQTQLFQAGATTKVAAVSLSGVTKDFGAVHAVRGIDLQLQQGEIVAFLGPNGAGKTTTIDMVLGLSRPTTGEVSVLGLQPRQAIARGLVSAVMQTGGLLRDYTAAQVVPFALLVPFVGAAATSIVFGERFGPLRLSGMLIVVCGIAIMLLSKRSQVVPEIA